MKSIRDPFQIPYTSNSKNGSRGSILVLVLAFIVILSFITVSFLEDATARIKYFGLFHNNDDLRVDAYSALEISLAVLNEYREIEGALWGPEQGWSDPLSRIDFEPINANTVTVRFFDEGGKLPLNELDYPVLVRLFDVLGFDLARAEELADSFLDWTDADDLRRLNGFDGDDYESKDPPYRPSNGPVRTWDEFPLIEYYQEAFWDEDGRPLPVWREFKSAVSLIHKGSININKANRTVLILAEELGLLDRYALDQYWAGSDGERFTADDPLIRNLEEFSLEGEGGLSFSTEMETLVVEITSKRGDAEFILQAIVEWSGANPAAGSAGSNNNTEAPAETPPAEEAESDEQTNRPDPKGNTKTKASTGAGVGYPFRVVQLLENNKI